MLYRCMMTSDETVRALYLSSLPSKISSTSTARSNVMFDANECWPNPTAHTNNSQYAPPYHTTSMQHCPSADVKKNICHEFKIFAHI